MSHKAVLMRVLASVGIFLSLGLGARGQGSAGTREEGKLRVLTLNMRQWTRDTDSSLPTFWRTRMEAMERMIEDVDPDVICFQEFLAPVGQYVPDRYKRVGITVSHPIYVHKGLRTSGHSVGIWWDACTVAGVQVFCIHSHWDKEKLQKTVDQVNARLTGRDIACGDWNNGLKAIVNSGLKMQSVRTILSVPETDTFANFSRPEKSHGAIDHFFVTGLQPLSYRMLTDCYGCDKISDHFPLVIDVRL